MTDRRTEESIARFCAITGASPKDGRKFIDRYKRLDVAIDAYYGDSTSPAARHGDRPPPSTSKLSALFEKYKDPDGDEIGVDGTIKLCEDLKVDPEDVVLLAVAYELRSPKIGVWTKQGWIHGWKNIGCDTIEGMQQSLTTLRDGLASDPAYFQKVYIHTFDFAKEEGQRSLALESAQAFWNLLLSHGLKGGALVTVPPKHDSGDVEMIGRGGWKEEYTQWWFEFLNERGGKGVSKDTWAMFLEFVRTIDVKFSNYDAEAAWPSTIDDFVEYARNRLPA
ncbi:hypothetical protein AX17_003805 [Amanita inopinata Kibby_2008]|nr:hypothetical protein AX17_003805 [Amanita inopinata Kibby_2008]